jgi:hypothetical protein
MKASAYAMAVTHADAIVREAQRKLTNVSRNMGADVVRAAQDELMQAYAYAFGYVKEVAAQLARDGGVAL